VRRPRLQPAERPARPLCQLRAGEGLTHPGLLSTLDPSAAHHATTHTLSSLAATPSTPHHTPHPPLTASHPPPHPLKKTITPQNVTWEGDNNVLCLQTARFMLKAMAASARPGAAAPAAGGSAAYLGADALRQELGARCAAQVRVRSACLFPASTVCLYGWSLVVGIWCLAHVCSPKSNQPIRTDQPTNRNRQGEACWLQPETILAALRHRASRLAATAVDTLRGGSLSGRQGR
jgi:hypothetical protein